MKTTETAFQELLEQGREITRRIAEAAARGDEEAVDRLLREKDRIHRMRRELNGSFAADQRSTVSANVAEG